MRRGKSRTCPTIPPFDGATEGVAPAEVAVGAPEPVPVAVEVPVGVALVVVFGVLTVKKLPAMGLPSFESAINLFRSKPMRLTTLAVRLEKMAVKLAGMLNPWGSLKSISTYRWVCPGGGLGPIYGANGPWGLVSLGDPDVALKLPWIQWTRLVLAPLKETSMSIMITTYFPLAPLSPMVGSFAVAIGTHQDVRTLGGEIFALDCWQWVWLVTIFGEGFSRLNSVIAVADQQVLIGAWLEARWGLGSCAQGEGGKANDL